VAVSFIENTKFPDSKLMELGGILYDMKYGPSESVSNEIGMAPYLGL
jgi:hypothetical protein